MFRQIISFISILLTTFSVQAATAKYDIIIIGGGVIGLASAYYGAKTDKKILLLEKDTFQNEHGGSNSIARQFRIQYNDPKITQLAIDTIPLWRELQQTSGEEVFIQSGCLWFGDLKSSTIEGSIQTSMNSLRKLGLNFEVVDAEEIQKRFHFSNLPPDWGGLLEPNGGWNNVKATLRALYKGAKGKVDLREFAHVTNIESTDSGVVVKTAKETFEAKKLILAPGAEINDLLSFFNLKLNIDIWEMVLVYYKQKNKQVNYPVWLVFQEGTEKDPNRYYGFPADRWQYSGYVQVGSNYPSRIHKSLATYRRKPDPQTVTNITNWVRQHMKDLDPQPKFPVTCVVGLFTDPQNKMALKHEMLLDFAPETVPGNKNIIICTTGWAFKLAPILGKICIDLATKGSTEYDISSFKFAPDMLAK